MHFLLSLDKNKYAIVTGKHVLGAKRYRSLESTCTQEPSEFGHCQGATMRARYDARRSGNVARMKGERVWRVQRRDSPVHRFQIYVRPVKDTGNVLVCDPDR